MKLIFFLTVILISENVFAQTHWEFKTQIENVEELEKYELKNSKDVKTVLQIKINSLSIEKLKSKNNQITQMERQIDRNPGFSKESVNHLDSEVVSQN